MEERPQTGTPRFGRQKAAWVLVAGYACLILAVSSIPSHRMPDLNVWDWDKLIHAVEYFLFACLVTRALARTWSRSYVATAAASWLLCAGFGVVDELYQSTVPGRDSSVFDMLADAAGAALGVFVATRLWSLRE